MAWLNEYAKMKLIVGYIGLALLAICLVMVIIYAIMCGIERLTEHIEKKKRKKWKRK